MYKLKRIRRSIIIKFINRFLCGTHFFNLKRSLLRLAGIKCGENTKVVGPIILGNVSNVSFGNDVWVGTNFIVHGNGTVNIEDFCDIAPEVSILTGSHEISSNQNHRAGEGISYNVNIGKGCWIGSRVTIMGNSQIGDGCVVAALSFVNKSVDSNTLWAGIPAKFVRKI